MSWWMLNVGVSVAQVLFRILNANPVADGLGDAAAGLNAWQARRPSADATTRALGKAITQELTQRLGGLVDEGPRADVRAASLDIAAVFDHLPNESLLEAARSSENFHAYVLNNGGKKILSQTSSIATPFAERLLEICSEILVENAPTSAHFSTMALQSLLRDADKLSANQVRMLDQQDAIWNTLEVIRQAMPIHHEADADTADIALDTSKTIRKQLDPDILPSIQRADFIDVVLTRPEPMQAIIGEGGLGKSTLAGQLYDLVHQASPTVLLNCSTLLNTHRLDSAELLDIALGEQAGAARVPLSAILRVFPERPKLILDTLDIVLREETADDIHVLLHQYMLHADVVVFCRSREWHDLLGTTHEIALAHVVPKLTRNEVITWARTYTNEEALDPAVAEEFITSVAAAADIPRGVHVLGVPLRLAMACRLYAASGTLPPDLTATRLYDEYWSRRVATGRDGRRNTRTARAAQETSLAVAESIWQASTERFIEDVPLPASSGDALNGLLSEGILVEIGYRVHFFHQTFAEFAVARYLAARANSEDLSRLQDGLCTKRSGYWGIVGHLVFEQLSEERLREIFAAVPRTPEGVWTILSSAFAREEPLLASNMLEEIVQSDPTSIAAASDLLGTAPAQHRAAAAGALLAILPKTQSDLTATVRALGVLIGLESDKDAATLLTHTMDCFFARGHKRDKLVASEWRRLLDAVFRSGPRSADHLIEPVIDKYEKLPIPARLAVCLAVSSTKSSKIRSAFLDKALKYPVPNEAVDACTTIAICEWEDRAARARRSWMNWDDILATNLPTRWDAVQVRLLAAIATDDETIKSELIRECIRPYRNIPRNCLLSAVRFVADAAPEEVVGEVLRIGVDETPLAVTGLSQLALQLQPHLGVTQSRSMIKLLQKYVELEPRRSWPAIVKLSAIDAALLDSALTSLIQTVTDDNTQRDWGVVVASALDALVQVRSPQQLQHDGALIDRLLMSTPHIDVQRQVSLIGALSLVSAHARARIDSEIDLHHIKSQRRLIQKLLSRREQWDEATWSDSLPWLVSLLRARSDGGVIALSNVLKKDVRNTIWTQHQTSAAIDRLKVALEQEDDPQTSGSLLALVAATAHEAQAHARPSPEQVIELIGIYRESLARCATPDRRSALYNQYAAVLSNVAKAVLPMQDVINKVSEFAMEIDTATIAEGARRTLAQVLASLIRSVPAHWAVFEAIWPRIPSANRWALAEVALSGLVPDRDEVGARLARREDCPPDVAAYVLRRLH